MRHHKRRLHASLSTVCLASRTALRHSHHGRHHASEPNTTIDYETLRIITRSNASALLSTALEKGISTCLLAEPPTPASHQFLLPSDSHAAGYALISIRLPPPPFTYLLSCCRTTHPFFPLLRTASHQFVLLSDSHIAGHALISALSFVALGLFSESVRVPLFPGGGGGKGGGGEGVGIDLGVNFWLDPTLPSPRLRTCITLHP